MFDQKAPTSEVDVIKQNCLIECYDFEKLTQLLNDPNNVRVKATANMLPKGESQYGLTIFSSTEDPHVLVEARASFCSVFLTFDAEGNGVLLHTVITPPSDVDEVEFSEYVDDDLVEYRDRVRRVVRMNDNRTVLTGHTDSTENNANLVAAALADFLGPGYEQIERFTEPFDLMQYGMNSAEGLIFIPKQLSSNGKNVVLFIGDHTSTEDFEKLRQFVSLQKGKERIQAVVQ